MDLIEWIFSGVGSTIVGILLTLLLGGGGVATYRVVSTRRKMHKLTENVMEEELETGQVQQQSSGTLSPVVYGHDNQVSSTVNNTTNNYNIIGENFINKIVGDVVSNELQDFRSSLVSDVTSRLNSFETQVANKIQEQDEAIEALKRPEVYQDTLNAFRSAAFSSRNSDYEVLAELLSERYKTNDVGRGAGIHNAINIVNQVTDEAMLGLTLLYCYLRIKLMGQNVSAILENVDEIFSKLMYAPLPKGKEWFYNLDMLNAVSINYTGEYKKPEDVFADVLKDYIVKGISKNSDAYMKAKEFIKAASFPVPISQVLIANDLLEDHIMVNGLLIYSLKNTGGLSINRDGQSIPYSPTNVQKAAIRKVLALYDKPDNKKINMKDLFSQAWNKRVHLKTFSSWLTQIPHEIILTPIGEALAHANASRYIPVPQFKE